VYPLGVTSLIQDLRFSLRMLMKTPAFSSAAILTLALAIGANAAIFSVVHAVLLRPLPFKDPSRLVWVWSKRVDRDKAPFNLPDFIDYRDRDRSCDAIAGMAYWSADLTGTGDAERIQGLRVSANLFALLGVEAAVGRTLVPEDDRPGAARVVVLTDGLWHRRFGGDHSLIGRSLVLDGSAYAVVGVLPAEFLFPIREAEFAAALAPDTDPLRTVRTSVNFLKPVARLKPTVTLEQAQEEMTAVAKELQREYPDANARKAAVKLVPLAEEIVGTFRAALWALFGAVGGVLLIACANLASLVLARGTVRRKEMAIRQAAGATRVRLVRQLLTESLVIGALGGGLGTVLAAEAVRLLVAVAPVDLPRLGQVDLNDTVLAFTVGISLLSSVLFGLLPALLVSRTNLTEELKDGGRGSSEGKDRRRARTALVTAEVALALMLLIVAALFGRSFANIQAVRPGFDPDRVLSTRISLPPARFATNDSILSYQRLAVAGVNALPGVQSAGAISLLPVSGLIAQIPFIIEGRPTPNAQVPSAQYRLVTEAYFQTMRIPLRSGRLISEWDTATTSAVILVNETLAHRFFGALDPVGKRLMLHDTNTEPRTAEIVGVIADVKQLGLDAEPTSDIYVPYAQVPKEQFAWATSNMFWVVRTQGDVLGLSEQIRHELQHADLQVPISGLRTMNQYLSSSVAPRRFNLSVLGIFALAAVLLAGTGIYAMLSYSVSLRSHEMAIRAALGAERRDILMLVVGQGLRPAWFGVIVGVGGALVLTRALSSLLFGLSPTDPETFVIVSIGLVIVALAACIVPGLRATRTAIAGSSRVS
jgi:predicted permease